MKKIRIDNITITLIVFIVFIVALFFYMIKLNEDIKQYSFYDANADELILTNKDIDNFLLQNAVFINYDEINSVMLKFEKILKTLNINKVKSKLPQKYTDILNKLAILHQQKSSWVEYFKATNTQLLYSMHYLFDLNKLIEETNNIKIDAKKLTNSILLNLMKYYINKNISAVSVQTQLDALRGIAHNDDTINLFIEHVDIDIKRIVGLNNIKIKQQNDNTQEALKQLQTIIDDDYSKNIEIEKTIVAILFLFEIIILAIIIFMNRLSIKLKDELLSFKTAIENSFNSVVMTDVNKNIIYVNEMAQKETGYTKEELLGQNPRILNSFLNHQSLHYLLKKALENGNNWSGEFINKRKDGSLFHEKASIMPLYQDKHLTGYLAIKLNITDYIQERKKAEYLAFHDALTSLPNRYNLEHYLRKRLIVAKRENIKIALLFIDLDGFKTINDTLGHNVGDELLIKVSQRIKKALRASDIVARVGGDEFVIVIDSISNTYSPAHVCKNILNLFKEPIETLSHSLSITLSIGVSLFPDDSTEYSQLYKFADIAMYEAKDNGKNRYRYYKKYLSEDVSKRMTIEQSLINSISNNEIYVLYQPQYNLMTKEIVGLEALVRWNSKDLSNIGPDIFIPIAEEMGFIVELGLYIFRQACTDFLLFKQYSSTIKHIAINVSPVQLYQESFLQEITKITNELGILPKNIILEITETQIMKNIKQSIKLLNEIRNLGFSISIDDFGTGHSSLSYLKLLPVNELKIDKSFVDGLPTDKSDLAISKSIITLSQSMDYINVAEGIETQEQEDFLRNNNCQIGQGFLFSKPQNKTALIEFLISKTN